MPAPVIVGVPLIFSAASGASHTLPRPDGLQAGDLLVAHLRSQGSNWPTDWTPPAGWTRHGPAFVGASAARVSSVYVRQVTDPASEPSSGYVFMAAASDSRRQGDLWVVRGGQQVTACAGTYGGTAVANGRTTPSYTPVFSSGEPGLTMLWADSEFGAGASHVPASTPAGYTQAATLVSPSALTTVSRTYTWVGTAPHAAGTVVPDATVTWGSTSSASAVALTIEGVPAVDPTGDGLAAHDGAGSPVRVYVTTPDGPRTPTELRQIPRGYPSVSAMLSAGEMWWAHRGGSASFPECSLWAYTQSALRGWPALEVSLSRTADGVWIGLHDQTLDRTSGVTGNLDPSTMTWAQVQAYLITIGAAGAPQPYMTWDQLIEAYGDTHVIICDPKYQDAHRAEFVAKAAADLGDRCVVKGFYSSTGLRDAAQAAGLVTWGYSYEASLADPLWTTKATGWDLGGMDYTASQAAWDSILALGKPVLAHICPTEAAVTTARSKGASGFQCSGTAVITPGGS